MTTTKDQVKSAVQMTLAVAEAIRAAGSIPSGHLYAMLMSKIDLEGYNRMIAVLVDSGCVKLENHLLTWVGPKEAK